jgi:hypothetical protein
VVLQLEVVDFPKKDAAPRPFWLAPLAGLGQPWGEGASATRVGVSGAGSGAPAEKDDATWFHTMYDPDSHDETTFIADGPGFWSEMGALGDAPLDPQAAYGDPAAVVNSALGPVSLTSAGMETDVNNWLQDGSSNFGWIVLGDENIEGDSVSSKRGFASREHENVAYRPTLTFEYSVSQIPEPGSVALLITGTIAALLLTRRRRAPSTL